MEIILNYFVQDCNHDYKYYYGLMCWFLSSVNQLVLFLVIILKGRGFGGQSTVRTLQIVKNKLQSFSYYCYKIIQMKHSKSSRLWSWNHPFPESTNWSVPPAVLFSIWQNSVFYNLFIRFAFQNKLFRAVN